MAKSLSTLPIVSFLLLLLISNSGEAKSLAEAQKTWCVAKPSSSEAELKNNIIYACEHAGTSCNKIKYGGSCYEPNTLINHASVAMNLYYAAAGRNYWNCNFTNSGLTTITDPSFGSCKYA